MTGTTTSTDTGTEGVAQAMQLAADELRLRTATCDQLKAAAAFLASALARFPDGASRDARKSDAIARLERAGKAIGAEQRRRAFV
jgi:hypothetical protein